MRLQAADDLIFCFNPVLESADIGLALRKLLRQLDAMFFSLLALGSLLLSEYDSLMQLLLQTGYILLQTEDFLVKALSHFMWSFRAFLDAGGNHLILLFFPIAEVFLVRREFSFLDMLLHTTIKVLDRWNRDLLCTKSTILRLTEGIGVLSNILVVILHLMCQVLIIA